MRRGGNNPTALTAHLLLLLLAVIWGSAYVAIKEMLRSVNPVAVAEIRFLIGLPLFVLIALSAGRPPRLTTSQAGWLILMGLCGVPFYHLFLNLGETQISAGEASLLVALSPVFTVVLGALIGVESVDRWKAAGIVLALMGLVTIVVIGSGGGGAASPWGGLSVVAAALAWAVYTLISKRAQAWLTPRALASYPSLVGVFFLLLALPWAGLGNWHAMTGGGWLAAAFLGLVSTFLGYLVWQRALRVLEPSLAAVYLYLCPLVSLVEGWAFLGEAASLRLLVGGCMVLAGVVLANRSQLSLLSSALTGFVHPGEGD